MRNLAVLFCCFFLASSFVAAQALDERKISNSELRGILKSEDSTQIIIALNKAKRNIDSPDLMKFILQIWDGSSQKQVDLPWVLINSPRIRIEIANILIQANNNNFIKIDRNAIRKYVIKVINSEDYAAIRTAIHTLGLIGNSDDLVLLKSISMNEDQNTFRISIISIARKCSPGNISALKELETHLKGSENREYVKMSIMECQTSTPEQ